jgi:hypothetical protein
LDLSLSGTKFVDLSFSGRKLRDLSLSGTKFVDLPLSGRTFFFISPSQGGNSWTLRSKEGTSGPFAVGKKFLNILLGFFRFKEKIPETPVLFDLRNETLEPFRSHEGNSWTVRSQKRFLYGLSEYQVRISNNGYVFTNFLSTSDVCITKLR